MPLLKNDEWVIFLLPEEIDIKVDDDVFFKDTHNVSYSLENRKIYGYGIKIISSYNKKEIIIKKIIGFIKPFINHEQQSNMIYAIFNDFNLSYLSCLACGDGIKNDCKYYTEYNNTDSKPLSRNTSEIIPFETFVILDLVKSNIKTKVNRTKLIFTQHMFFNVFGLRPQKFIDKKYIPNHHSCTNPPTYKAPLTGGNVPTNIIPLFGDKCVYVINLDKIIDKNFISFTISFSVKVYYNKTIYQKYINYINEKMPNSNYTLYHNRNFMEKLVLNLNNKNIVQIQNTTIIDIRKTQLIK
jgi:hypothetical protein